MTSYAKQEQSQQPWLRMSAAGRNVLIVDDNPTNRKLLREILQAERYTTVEAEDGLEALFTLEREPFDIVVCDILMPNMDGYSLCTEVRRRPEFNHLFFILYTSIDFTPDDEKRGLEVGADRFISKQGSLSMILKSIEEGIGERRERRCEHARRTNEFPPMKEMKKYNALMIRQLEENSIELEQTRDELRNLNQELEQRIAERTRELREKNDQIEEDLKMARELQMALLPQQFPSIPRGVPHADSAIKFSSFYYPTGSVSGDFFFCEPPFRYSSRRTHRGRNGSRHPRRVSHGNDARSGRKVSAPRPRIRPRCCLKSTTVSLKS